MRATSSESNLKAKWIIDSRPRRYGVARVYDQQCRYTLTDVQAMHDRLRSMLGAIPGTALDPTAGKARFVAFYCSLYR